MLLSHKTTIALNDTEANIIGHMCYAAYKLWNICNYERIHYKEMKLEKYPDWYYQKSVHKDELWSRQLPSQTAQEICKQLDKSWRSFYALEKSRRTDNPRPPRFKHGGMCITYMQNGLKHEKKASVVRLSLSKQLRRYMEETYGIEDRFIFLKNRIFEDFDAIKQIKLYPPEADRTMRVIVVYEVNDAEIKCDNGRYLSIDPGLHNLMTCYDNEGYSFIAGRKYLSITRYFDKEIARVQGQWASAQVSKGIKYPKPSKHVLRLYRKKKNTVHDYLHKVTTAVVKYCIEHDIHTVVIGDLTNIRRGLDKGAKTNQKLHSWPYATVCMMLEYKLRMQGISLIRQEESYSSQCSPFSAGITEEEAEKTNRIQRGLYKDECVIFNADAVGAFNIMRKYQFKNERPIKMSVTGLKNTELLKVAV